jgi:hypothetical protein
MPGRATAAYPALCCQDRARWYLEREGV